MREGGGGGENQKGGRGKGGGGGGGGGGGTFWSFYDNVIIECPLVRATCTS